MTEKTMTTREFYAAVLDLADTGAATDPSMTFGGKSVVDISNKASELIAALDARNAKRKGTESKDKREARERREAVLNFLCDHQGEQFTRDSIAEGLGITPAQVSVACKVLIADDTIVRDEVKIDKARRVVYSYPTEE